MVLPPSLAALVLVALPVVALGAPPSPQVGDEAVVRHVIEVRLDPEAQRLEAVGRVSSVPGAARVDGGVLVRLHGGLELECVDPALVATARGVVGPGGDESVGSGESGPAEAVRTWLVARRDGAPLEHDAALVLAWSGRVHSEIRDLGGEYARSFSTTPGIIDAEGVVLGGASWWIPTFGEELVTFELTVDLPGEWDAVSQGERTRHEVVEREGEARRVVTWSSAEPMEEIHLIGARFHEYSTASGNVTAYAFLREDDPVLANKYLEVTAQYIEMYRQLIGPYPFSKFALVENFWETGYGMPSFTLLGPAVIRLPFILHSSYPHEILHNWWGNGVYVDYESGNWCEGLTAYLADHLIKEGRGLGVDYRRDTLDAYRNHVGSGRDFPLTEFRSRHSAATQAVGYGKSLMTWHMLRQRIGDEAFAGGLQRFYRRFKFRKASFGDLEAVFSEASGEDLGEFFRQWVERTGAPVLEARVTREGGELAVELAQTQGGDAYLLSVPVALTRSGATEAEVRRVAMVGPTARFTTPAADIVRVDVDPEFDLFRRLHREEIPPSFSGVFGAERTTLVVPSAADDPLAAAWRTFAEGWREGEEQLEVVAAGAIDALPADRCVWILGRDNPWRGAIGGALAARGATPPATGCFAYAVRHPADPDLTVGWIGGGNAAALPGLARKLPHYGKYSFLEFEGDEPTNSAKGQWPATDSPLVWTRDGAAVERGSLPGAEPLAELAPTFDPAVLAEHVETLSAPAMEGRGAGTAGIELAARYVADAFAEAGLEPGGDGGGDGGGFLQEWVRGDGPDGGEVRLANVIGVLPGTDPERAGESVVVAAHYDHLGHGWPDARSGNEGVLHPGADDNASGVAVLIELARDLARSHSPSRTIVFAAFSAEEWDLAGSRHYLAATTRWPKDKIFAMVNMDSVGRLEGKPITVFGCSTASEWVHIARGIGFVTGIPSTCVADDPGGSDQATFHEARIPAVQVFSGAHADYHRPSDTADKVDANGLVKVAVFMKEMVLYLSERPEPMSVSFPSDPAVEAKEQRPARGGRRVSLGTVPDFEFQGPGVRISSVVSGSAAEAAGLAAGDVLLAIDDAEVTDLRSYSQLLGTFEPGDSVRLGIRRGDETLRVQATLRAR